MTKACVLIAALLTLSTCLFAKQEISADSMAASIGQHHYIGRVFVVTESEPVKKIEMSSALVFFRKEFLASGVQKSGSWEFSLNLDDGTTTVRARDGSMLKVPSSSVLFYDDRNDRFARLDEGFSYAAAVADEERIAQILQGYAERIVMIEESEEKAAQPGATDNPGDAQ